MLSDNAEEKVILSPLREHIRACEVPFHYMQCCDSGRRRGLEIGCKHCGSILLFSVGVGAAATAPALK